MAYDKVVDSAALDAAITYTANRIRNKTGGTDQIAWDSAKGFGDAVDAITGGSSAPESDPREVYQGTRPAEWLRLPDYDKITDNTAYFLLALYPSGKNNIRIALRTNGSCTITAGTVSNGEFVPFENDDTVTVAGNGNEYVKAERTFNFADYNTAMSDGTKQIVIKVNTTDTLKRITFYGDGWLDNHGVLDIILKAINSEHYVNFSQNATQRGCLYFYTFDKGIPISLKHVKYIATASGEVEANAVLYMPQLVKIIGTFKVESNNEVFRDCNNLREVTCDISTATSFSNPFRNTCYSLRTLTFTGGESLTAFPSDINLAHTALDADAVLAFFNTLPNISTGTARTITLANTPAATAGIPEATLAVATNKGWTVVTA
jgi:hypothetical protein